MSGQKNARYRNFQHYIDEGWAPTPKKTFEHVASVARSMDIPAARVLDIGCATGELVAFLKTQFPDWEFDGIDLFDPLIEQARRNVPGANFYREDLLTLDQSFDQSYDVIFAVGVVSLFAGDDLERFWARIHKLLKPGGRVIVLGPLNEYGVDMDLRHRKWIDGKRGDWESGWSIPSVQTVSELIDEQFSSFTIEPYAPQIDLSPRSDPIRTWTIPFGDKPRQLTNGLKLLVDYFCIVATA